MNEPPVAASEQDSRDAQIVSQHLDEGYTAGPEALASGSPGEDSPPQSSLALQGGDIHRDIYKIQAKSSLLKRSATLGASTAPNPSTGPVLDSDINVGGPGGFRRQYVLQRSPSRFQAVIRPTAKSFVTFLELYGGFAGEKFAESDNESVLSSTSSPESRPLLPRRRRTYQTGDAGVTRTFFTLIKAFIGTGILFLPKAFRNGGILFSSLTLITISTISYVCFRLLLSCREKYQCGYGDLGAAVGGPWLRRLILSSIFVSQMGFVCAGLIFTADNLYAFFDAVTPGPLHVSVAALVAIQLILIVPLGLLRNMSKLGPVAFAADVFIFFGLIYIWWYTISTLSIRGKDPTMVLFNHQDFALTIGSSIFTFEGIGLIVPIQSAMAEPRRFPGLLLAVMIIITAIFTSIGALCYATFGVHTRVEIISNFPSESRLVNSVQFLYALAVLGGAPVRLFPAIRVMETSLFAGKSGKRDPWTKWRKNLLRSTLALICVVISIAAADHLDKFVALSGAFACVPLVYIYPPLLHLKGVAKSMWATALDILILGFGAIAMIYTTGMTLMKLAQG